MLLGGRKTWAAAGCLDRAKHDRPFARDDAVHRDVPIHIGRCRYTGEVCIVKPRPSRIDVPFGVTA